MFRKIFFHFLAKKEFKGVLELEFGGKKYSFGSPLDANNSREITGAQIKVKDANFFKRVVLFGDTGFGEAFFSGEFETENLKKILLWFVQNKENLPGFKNKNVTLSFLERAGIILRIEHFLNRNTKQGSRRNIKAHYDVSNDFYQLWLDPTMAYSGAIFDNTDDLEKAQENKYRRICEGIQLKKDDHVLEIGCGWGGFALYAAKNYACRLTLATISAQQYEFARQKIQQAGLENKIVLQLKDYRELEGAYDKIVSIEMMEALGHQYVPPFMKKCADLLNRGGLIFLQCITYPEENFAEYIKNPNYIKKYIFPGGELLSLAQVKKEAKNNCLEILSVENIGKDYAKTLQVWRNNLTSNRQRILDLGFDEEFYKKWFYYFVYCEVGFETGYIDDAQILLQKTKSEN